MLMYIMCIHCACTTFNRNRIAYCSMGCSVDCIKRETTLLDLSQHLLPFGSFMILNDIGIVCLCVFHQMGNGKCIYETANGI